LAAILEAWDAAEESSRRLGGSEPLASVSLRARIVRTPKSLNDLVQPPIVYAARNECIWAQVPGLLRDEIRAYSIRILNIAAEWQRLTAGSRFGVR
jgi:hypothetical protein